MARLCEIAFRQLRIATALALLLLAPVAALGASTQSQDSRQGSLTEAFYELERSPFAPGVIERAVAALSDAAASNKDDPWLYIVASRVSLQAGYRSGDQFVAESYSTDALRQALAHAMKAVDLGPKLIPAFTQLARVQLLLRDINGTLQSLVQAERLDANNERRDFYIAFFNAVVLRVQNAAYDYLAYHLDSAEKRASEPYQRRFVNRERLQVAMMRRDFSAAEQFHKRAIELEPDNAHIRGNYGSFLLWLRRYDEAVSELEAAIAIRPYPLAEEELNRARLLRDAARRQK